MSKLLIGASSPIAYAYYTEKERGRPAPILESPISYILLYDELWFAHRNLCPFELDQELPFVHFVNEQFNIDLDIDIPDEENRRLEAWNWDVWKRIVDAAIDAQKPWYWDNHARPVEIAGSTILPTPGSRAALFVDRQLCNVLKMELAENTPNSAGSAKFDREILRMALSEKLLNERFASPRAPEGFWHPCLLDLREDKSLKAYRSKLTELNPTDIAGLDAKVKELVAEYEREMRKALKEKASMMGWAKSTAMFISGLIPGLDIPSKIASGIDWIDTIVSKAKNTSDYKWMAFLASVDEAKEKKMATD